MSIEAIVSDLETVNAQLLEVRNRLLAEKRKHLDAIKAIDSVIGSMPAPKAVVGKSHNGPKPEDVRISHTLKKTGNPSIGEAVLEVVKGKPGVTTAEIAAALPAMKRKSVDNAVSGLTSKGQLVRSGKAYAIPVATAAE